MSENKTPYELRLEMLQLAKEMLERNFEIQREVSLRYWDTMVENANKLKSSIPSPDEVMNMMPKFPTLDDVIAQAEKMNEFVSGLKKK